MENGAPPVGDKIGVFGDSDFFGVGWKSVSYILGPVFDFVVSVGDVG